MASAFAQGFQMGSEAYDASEKMRLAKAAEARADKEFARKEKGWATEDAVQQAIATGQQQTGTGYGDAQARMLAEQGGDDPEFAAAARQSAIDVGRENVQRAQAAGALPQGMQVKTADQAQADTIGKVRALDWKAGQAMEAGDLQIQNAKQTLKKGGLEVKALERQASFDDKFDKVMGGLHQESATRLQDIETTAQTGGMKGLVEKFGPELKKALGSDVQLVGNNIVVKEKGQKPRTISSLSEAVSALEGAAQMEFGKNLESRMISEGLFKTPQELVKYFQDKREADRKDRDTDSTIAYRAAHSRLFDKQGAYYDRGGASANKQTQGQILTEKIDAYATIMMKADPNLSRADAEKRAAQVIMRDPEAKPEMTPADVNSFLKDQAGTVIRVDPNTKKPVRLGDLPLEEQLQIARQSLGRSGMPGAASGGLPDVNPKAMVKPGAAAAPAAPAQQGGALPLTSRLSAAINRDNSAGNRNQFTTLAAEVEKTLPGVQSQIAALEKALPLAGSASERANIQGRIDELSGDLPIMQSILEQRRAAIGY